MNEGSVSSCAVAIAISLRWRYVSRSIKNETSSKYDSGGDLAQGVGIAGSIQHEPSSKYDRVKTVNTTWRKR
jgi:hypothetical protein